MVVLAVVINILLSAYIFVLVLRGLLTLLAADLYNPLCQMIYRLSEPAMVLVRMLYRRRGKIDIGCWLLAYILMVLKFFMLASILGQAIHIHVLLMAGLNRLALTVINIYIFSLIVLIISRWFVSPMQQLKSPLLNLLQTLTAPLLRPLRLLFSITKPFDFSAMVGLFVLSGLSLFLR